MSLSPPDIGALPPPTDPPLLGAVEVVRRRYAPGSLDPASGRWTAGLPTDARIRASVQPGPGSVVEVDGRGLRRSTTVRLYTRADLRSASQHDGTRADRVWIPQYAAWFDVMEDGRWKNPGFGLRHQEIRCERVAEGTDEAIAEPEEDDP